MVYLSCRNSPVYYYLPWPFFFLLVVSIPTVLSQLSCPSCPVPAVLSQLSCPSCPVPAVLSQLSRPSFLVTAFLAPLSWTSYLVPAVRSQRFSQLSCPSYLEPAGRPPPDWPWLPCDEGSANANGTLCSAFHALCPRLLREASYRCELISMSFYIYCTKLVYPIPTNLTKNS